MQAFGLEGVQLLVGDLNAFDDTADNADIFDMARGKRMVLVDGKGTFALSHLGSLCGA
ncbi:MAG: hypothetical protein ABI124_06715 [Terrimesophilobacter sp.]